MFGLGAPTVAEEIARDPAAAVPPIAAPPIAPPLPAAPPPLQLVPDAVTGGTEEQRADAAKAAQTGQPIARAETTFGTPIAPEEYDTDDEFKERVLGESEEAFAKRKLDRAQAIQDLTLGKQAEAARKFAEQADQDHNDFIESRDLARADANQLTREAQELANVRIDPEKWWADRNTGQKIAAFISVIAGGLVAPYQGGRNDGLAMIQGAIDRDIDAQKANLAGRRAALADKKASLSERFAQLQNDYRELERYRVASYERTINQVATEAQRFDPRGSAAIAYRETITALRGQQAKAIQAYRQQALKNELDTRKALREEAESKQQIAASKAQVAQGWARYSLDKTKAKDDKEIAEKKLAAEVDKLKAEGNTKAAEQLQKFGVAVPGMKTADGKPFVAQGTPESVGKLREQLSAANTLVGLIDEARRIRSGYSSSVKNREEWQRLQTIWASLTAEGKNLLGLGALSGDDMKLMTNYLGADDPTKNASIAAGVEQARKNILRKARDSVRAVDPTGGASFDIPDPLARTRQETDNDRMLQKILTVDKSASGLAASSARDIELREHTRPGALPVPAQHGADAVIDTLAKWEIEAASGDPAVRDQALASLGKVATDASPEIKRLARDALGRIGSPSALPIVEEAGAPSGSTVKEPAIDQYGLPVEPQ
jgi:hypothetical protein